MNFVSIFFWGSSRVSSILNLPETEMKIPFFIRFLSPEKKMDCFSNVIRYKKEKQKLTSSEQNDGYYSSFYESLPLSLLLKLQILASFEPITLKTEKLQMWLKRCLQGILQQK